MRNIIIFLFVLSCFGCDLGDDDGGNLPPESTDPQSTPNVGTLCVGTNVEAYYSLCNTLSGKCSKLLSPPQDQMHPTNCLPTYAGTYKLTFGDMKGYEAPPPQTFNVIQAETTKVYGNYAESPP